MVLADLDQVKVSSPSRTAAEFLVDGWMSQEVFVMVIWLSSCCGWFLEPISISVWCPVSNCKCVEVWQIAIIKDLAESTATPAMRWSKSKTSYLKKMHFFEKPQRKEKNSKVTKYTIHSFWTILLYYVLTIPTRYWWLAKYRVPTFPGSFCR